LKRFLLATLFLILSIPYVYSLDSFEEGERLFMENKPEEAKTMFDLTIKNDPSNEKAYLYLGIVYQQLNRYEDSITIIKKAIPNASLYKSQLHFNAGNAYFFLKKMAFAEESYNQAIIENASYAIAYLNRANVRINLKDYNAAVLDYTQYLLLVPASEQKEKIEKIIALLNTKAEDDAKKALEAEAARLAEEERKKKLLEAVQDSLKAQAEETTNLSSGSESVQGYDDTFQLDD